MAQLPASVNEQIENLVPTATAKKDRESQAISNQQTQQEQLQQAMNKNVVDRTRAERALLIGQDLGVLKPIYEALSDDDPRAQGLLDLISRWSQEATELAAASDE